MSAHVHRRHTRALLKRQMLLLVVWAMLLAALTLGLGFVAKGCPQWCDSRPWLNGWDRLDQALAGIDVGDVSQLVAAIVIAIFVFAVGVAFVVAQVVPPARGARAVAALRGKRSERSVSPAPALILGAAFLVLGPPLQHELAVVVLLGAVAYTAISVVFLLSILTDATDPEQFKAKLLNDADSAIAKSADAASRLPRCPTAQNSDDFRPPVDPKRAAGPEKELQLATDALYEIVRTLRGWARVAARSNDSRELQQSLEGLLWVVKAYTTKVLALNATRLSAVPSQYWDHADAADAKLNPLTPPVEKALNSVHDSRKTSAPGSSRRPWELSPLVRRPEEKSPPVDVRVLPSTWFANEVGRAVVRATELALESQTLLDRDTFRLLNTLSHAAELSYQARPRKRDPSNEMAALACEWNAAIMLRYLTEIGLAVRHCPEDSVDWHFEPCIRLAFLHTKFKGKKKSQELADVAAAGALLVLEGLVVRHRDRPSVKPNVSECEVRTVLGAKLRERSKALRARGQASRPSPTPRTTGEAMADTLTGLRLAAPDFKLSPDQGQRAAALASQKRLEPSERAQTYQHDDGLLQLLIDGL